MKYPQLVPKNMCKIPCGVIIYGEGVGKDGEPEVLFQSDSLMCNYQDKAKTVYTKEQKLVQITGSAYFCGDIVPDVPTISSGEFTIFGVTRQIQQGTKARNPDGTVNYTLLEVV